MATRKSKFTPTDELRAIVEKMSGHGIQQAEIAQALDIDAKTLRRHFRLELDKATTIANTKVADALFLNATKKNNVVAQIFWLKTRARWRENAEVIDPAISGPVSKVVVEIQDPTKIVAARKAEAEEQRLREEASDQ